ncbi:hypothetical protein AWB94_10740 [Mycolicibacterium canariasense]|nr:hypothetical protein AWB94_10740 [Mycolicibacterium canariasense]
MLLPSSVRRTGIGLVVALALLAAEALIVDALRETAPTMAFGVLYLVGVLVVAIGWDFRVALPMAVVSAVALDMSRPVRAEMPITSQAQTWVVLVVFVAVALGAHSLAGAARSRLTEANQRREEAALIAEISRDMLRDNNLRVAMVAAQDRLASTLALPHAELVLGEAGPLDQRVVIPLRERDTVLGTLVVPAGLTDSTRRRLRRLAPMLQTVLAAARDREMTHEALSISRDEFRLLFEQQQALRRVATLVASGASDADIFRAVVDEMGRALGVSNSALWRFESDGTATLIAANNDPRQYGAMPVGSRWPLDGENIVATVQRSGRTARMDTHDHPDGAAALCIRELGLHGGVGAPIVVDGRLWGVAVVGSAQRQPLASDTEGRLSEFSELVATAIANAESHEELTASRARIISAADDARRRIERDLHDGAQQRLVYLALELRSAQATVPPELPELRRHLDAVAAGLAVASTDLQELSRGIHPAILSKGGLGPALKSLARRSGVPVTLEVAIDGRLAQNVETATYYVVSEALTNATKHARAEEVRVTVQTGSRSLRLRIEDDGVGGADVSGGSGLIGLSDRVHALGGRLTVTSPTGAGTSLTATIPLG